jgi:response regulator RpfG family c-di-GMP phosphodiesterase
VLPGINGYEICKTIKTNDVTKHIPVLLISSQIGLDTETKSFEAGANDFIQKPFNSYILQQKVLSLLELKKLLFDKMTVEHEMDKKLQLPLDYDNKIILKVLEFIEQNLHDTELDTEMVSAAIGVSRTQVVAYF